MHDDHGFDRIIWCFLKILNKNQIENYNSQNQNYRRINDYHDVISNKIRKKSKQRSIMHDHDAEDRV